MNRETKLLLYMKYIGLISVDLLLLGISNIIALWIVYGGRSGTPLFPIAITHIGLILLFLIVVRFYRIRISESSLDLLIRSLRAFVPAFVIGTLITGFHPSFNSRWVAYLIATYVFGFMLILLTRISYRLVLSHKGKQESSQYAKAVIYGAGEVGSTLVRQYEKGKLEYQVVGFVDDDPLKQQSYVLGVRVYGGVGELESILKELEAKVLIIAITKIGQEEMLAAVDAANEANAEIKVIPSLFEIETELNNNKALDLRSLDYADLLGRQLIHIDREPIKEMVKGKRILVTGAGGSIGSEICRQLMTYGPSLLLLLDIDETELHDLSLRLHDWQREWSERIIPIICDIKDKPKLDRLFKKFKPDLIFHAAAYKHVPLQELYPEEAITTNILGSYALLKSAIESQVEKVVVISTDKAVNPTNVMGATKRAVELLASALTTDETEIVSVRFGNVLGSRGSMLPLFLDQINAGVPITVTHKEIIRYFMAIPEAVSLVFKAATMAKSGEVMVLDMGRPVKIYDFAQKLVKYYGNEKSQVVVTGLRPGEKLYEELLADSDTTIPTDDKLVFKAKLNNHIITEKEFVTEFLPAFNCNNPETMLTTLRKLVPEFMNNGI